MKLRYKLLLKYRLWEGFCIDFRLVNNHNNFSFLFVCVFQIQNVKPFMHKCFYYDFYFDSGIINHYKRNCLFSCKLIVSFFWVVHRKGSSFSLFENKLIIHSIWFRSVGVNYVLFLSTLLIHCILFQPLPIF